MRMTKEIDKDNLDLTEQTFLNDVQKYIDVNQDTYDKLNSELQSQENDFVNKQTNLISLLNKALNKGADVKDIYDIVRRI